MHQDIIDTHIHIWNFNKAEYSWLNGNTTILNKNYELEELEKERTSAGVTAGVLVQAANNFEDTDWMLDVAHRNQWIRGVVGWLPLTDPSQTSKALEHYGKDNRFKGVRHLIHDEQDPRWLLQENVLESLHMLAVRQIPYDLVGVLPAHIETALEVADRVPELKMVFDHLNQPPFSEGNRFGKWGDLMKEAAALQNFYVKISGLGTSSKKFPWTVGDVKPCIAYALELFSEDRCFCGGDWPVSLLAGTYTATWNIYRQVINELADGPASQKIFYHNAAKFYNL